jgi:hypothetical protein
MERIESMPGFEWLVYKFHNSQINAMLVWLDQCQQALSVVLPY